MGGTRRAVSVGAAIGLVAAMFVGVDARAGDPIPIGGVVTEQAYDCGKHDLPETGIQGDVPKADQDSGRAEQGYNCGLALVGHTTLGEGGRPANANANMAWAGDCAYVSGAGSLFGEPAEATDGRGVAVVDVSDPTAPKHVSTLRSRGATDTSETLHAVETPERSLLVVGRYGNFPGQAPNPMDVYDVTDCASPVLLAAYDWPENIHNLTISGNGRYVFGTQPLQAIDLAGLFDADPATGIRYIGNLDEAMPGIPFSPAPLADLDDALQDSYPGLGQYSSHEAWPTHDGTKLYLGGQLPTFETFTIVDIADWLAGTGKPRLISQRSGRGHSVRTATIGGTPFVVHSEEAVFGPTAGCIPETLNPVVGPSQPWLTDISDERNPVLVSQFGLDINDPEHCLDQLASGVRTGVHYQDVDDASDTTFVMASMWNAGVRIFDVRSPERPVEVAYFNPGVVTTADGAKELDQAWGHVRYVPEDHQIWFATASGGFWVVELEPQVRKQLGLTGGPKARHPEGRPARDGLELVGASIPVDLGWYCTLGL
jgi:hypothetical protein